MTRVLAFLPVLAAYAARQHAQCTNPREEIG